MCAAAITGDLAILAGHCNFCTALGMGEAHVILENGTSRSAACIGGMLTVMDGNCSLLATTWEWQEDIDATALEKPKSVPRKSWPRVVSPIRSTRS